MFVLFKDVQLLEFSNPNASLQSYAGTIYLRVINLLGENKIYLLISKTKVAPVKASTTDPSLTVPRLELCAALLLTQLL